MSIKFRPSDKVTIKLIDLNPIIEIGPVFNRDLCGWSLYSVDTNSIKNEISLFLENQTLDSNFNQTLDSDKFKDFSDAHHPILIKSDYRTFKNYFKLFKVRELHDRFYPATEQDLLDDLEFMHDEIANIKSRLNLINSDENRSFYNNLLNNPHLIFSFKSLDNYNAYVLKLTEIASRVNNENREYNLETIKQIDKIN